MMNSSSECSSHRAQPKVSWDTTINDKDQSAGIQLEDQFDQKMHEVSDYQPTTPVIGGRSKSGLELEEKIERRAQEVQELLVLGQVALDRESSSEDEDVQNRADESPAKRQRHCTDSWNLLFDYADEVGAQLQQIDHQYWATSKRTPEISEPSTEDTDYTSPERYVVPGDIVFVAESVPEPKQKLSLARTTQRLSKAKKVPTMSKEPDENLVPPFKNAFFIQQDTTKRFWPEVSQLKKDMKSLREKLNKAKTERISMSYDICELHSDLSTLEALRLPGPQNTYA